MNGIANKRHHQQRIKEKSVRTMKLWYHSGMSDRQIGRNASTHCRPCSCWMCQQGNRRPESKFIGTQLDCNERPSPKGKIEG